MCVCVCVAWIKWERGGQLSIHRYVVCLIYIMSDCRWDYADLYSNKTPDHSPDARKRSSILAYPVVICLPAGALRVLYVCDNMYCIRPGDKPIRTQNHVNMWTNNAVSRTVIVHFSPKVVVATAANNWRQWNTALPTIRMLPVPMDRTSGRRSSSIGCRSIVGRRTSVYITSANAQSGDPFKVSDVTDHNCVHSE